jgi:hypothetical protein
LLSAELGRSHGVYWQALKIELNKKAITFLPLTVAVSLILSPKQRALLGESPASSMVKAFLKAGVLLSEVVTA